jgi:hypothetical protein
MILFFAKGESLVTEYNVDSFTLYEMAITKGVSI